MNYLMKSGVLFDERSGQSLARIKGCFSGPEKQILSVDGEVLSHVGVRDLAAPPERAAACFREYVLYDIDQTEQAVAKPGCAECSDPAVGRPVGRVPGVDHASLRYHHETYLLTMKNTQNYVLYDSNMVYAAQIIHRGITGGWDIEAVQSFPPEFLCGLFVFCRYLEQENEFSFI